MNRIERVDRLTSQPVVGRMYLVRTVWGKYFNLFANWPVIGPKHEDREFFNFPIAHYHIDARFLPKGSFRAERAVAGNPFHEHANAPFGPIELRKRKCVRSDLELRLPYYANPRPIGELQRALAGHQCARGHGGFICPHRKASLGSIASIDGVITCPLHGLRIDAQTGTVLSPEGR